MNKLYTIGYATKALDVFIAQLARYRINAVADVRSVPYSRVFHAYHRETIATHLQQHNIRYVYLGDELGPRSNDDRHYDASGQVQFDRLMNSTNFIRGVERLTAGLDKGFNVALMCAEKDPAICHRSLLIGYYVARNPVHKRESDAQSIDILHIDHSGALEPQQQLEERLVKLHGLEADLFMSAEERRQQAYEIQVARCAYRKEG